MGRNTHGEMDDHKGVKNIADDIVRGFNHCVYDPLYIQLCEVAGVFSTMQILDDPVYNFVEEETRGSMKWVMWE